MKFWWFLVVGVLLGGGILGGGYLWWQRVNQPVAPGSSQILAFVVPKGQAAAEVGERLADMGVIKSSLAFKLRLTLVGESGQIQAGEYRLSPAKSLNVIVAELLSGPEDVWITFPEGWRKEQVAMRLVGSLGLVGEERQRWLAEFLSMAKEGYLFPDTYLIPREATPTTSVAIFRANFDRKVDETVMGQAGKLGRSLEEVVVMASVVERETKTDAERPIVAGILWKRLGAGWPLQADAPLQYAKATKICTSRVESCEDWWPVVTVADKEVDGGYNTYKRRGLPIGPIANPGLSSIKAAAWPQESEYWFYLHDGEGKIHFARTMEEHELNVAKYLR